MFEIVAHPSVRGVNREIQQESPGEPQVARTRDRPPPRKSANAKKPSHPSDTRSAPDPFSVVLPAIAALGAISSIATINWVAQEKTPARARVKRKVGTTLRDLETCCLGLADIFRRFICHPDLFCGEGGTKASPLKFGVHGPRVSSDTVRIYLQLINDVASMQVLASQNAFDVMSAVEDGEIDAPEQVFFGFGECQERLNALIQDRATMKTSVETGYEVAQKLSELVAELKKHRTNV